MYTESQYTGFTDMYELIEKYLKAMCTPAEEARLYHLLKEYGYSLGEEDIDKLLEEIPPAYYPDEATSHKMHQVISGKISFQRTKMNWRWLSAAAVLLITGSFLFYQYRLKQPEHTNVQWITQSNSGRGMTKIRMPDSSLIWLNAYSTVKYPENYVKNRVLRLSGEAFFQVKHHPTQPFSVQSGHLKIIVLGTSFNIKDYPQDRNSEVRVSTGKVGASAIGNHTQFLLPGEALSYDRISGHIGRKQVIPQDIDAWTKGSLVFNDEPLEEIINVFSRYYGIKFQFQTASLKRRKVTLRQRNESFTTIMKVLQISAGIRCHQSNDHILITDAR